MVDIKTELKLDDSLDSKLRRIMTQVIHRILDFCNREDLPEPLEYTVISIVEDMLKADGTVATKQEVTSISRGDTSISYRDKSATRKATINFISDHEKQLIKYKKIKSLR